MEASYDALATQMAGSHVRIAKYQADIDREFCNENLQLKTFPTIVYLPANSKQVKCLSTGGTNERLCGAVCWVGCQRLGGKGIAQSRPAAAVGAGPRGGAGAGPD
jgi:hypothetical protein